MKLISAYSGQEMSLEEVLSWVGRGWSNIIVDLISDLEKLGWDGQLCQVKEKYGGLRFYIGSDTDAINARISLAETQSMTICEDCGSPGTTQRCQGWYRTVCSDHVY